MHHDPTIQVLSKESRKFAPSPELSASAHVSSIEQYESDHRRSIEDPEGFWAEKAEQYLTWSKPWDKVMEWDFVEPRIEWFIGGKLNVSANCLDRHVESGLGAKTAILWESDEGETRRISYEELGLEVRRFANVLKSKGIRKGDRIGIYMPMIPELSVAMLACARIGAVHSVVFGGFSAHALSGRVNDCGAKLVVTADHGIRGGKHIPIKATVDEALEECACVDDVIVVRRTGEDVTMVTGRDHWYHDEINSDDISDDCPPEEMDAEDPLFILYTSGSTGKPKGILHTSAGYLLHATMSFQLVFDVHADDVHFCTADIGWVTGHSYIVYGPLAAGATTLMFEGVPTYPDPGRFWEIVEKHKVSVFYTAPTAVRTLMKEGPSWTEGHDLSSLRVLGSVGEPINPEAWIWYHDHVGGGKLPIVDTWWQTETGGILITPLPGAMTLKPGSASRPFYGVLPKILCEDGSEAPAGEGGYLVIDRPWPGMLRGMWGDHGNERFKEVYFSRFPGHYFSGDGAHMDEDGDYWLAGRVDDVVNVSGHRLGTAEVESALVSHDTVAEAAVVGFPHEVRGQGIAAFVILSDGQDRPNLAAELCAHVRKEVGPVATPDQVRIVEGLPKTRSGKIMRRILRKIAAGEVDDLGDISTLADPSVVSCLIEEMHAD